MTAGQGVFVGLLPEDKLPTTSSLSTSCRSVGKPITSTCGDPTVTVISTGCSGAVIIESAVLVSATKLMWVQVRSDDLATAKTVLGCMTHGPSAGLTPRSGSLCGALAQPMTLSANRLNSASRPGTSTSRPETDISSVAVGVAVHREPLEVVEPVDVGAFVAVLEVHRVESRAW